jgi:predicted O-methyltransferase YrrM
MDIDGFIRELPGRYGGDLWAAHPADRRFKPVLDDVPGMATEHKLVLLNLAAAHLGPGEAYLEVGAWKGLSLIGAMLGNPSGRFYAMENYLEFGADPKELRANLTRWVDEDKLTLLEGDCFRMLRQPGQIRHPVGVYFYDADHGRLSHYLALALAEPLLADRALVVIDDASWPVVAGPTDRYLATHPGYRLLWRLDVPADEDPRWWNGLRVYAFERPGRAAGRVGGWPGVDVAWRLAAYRLAYRPFMRLAWAVLSGRPRLRGLALRLAPTSSRQVGRKGAAR